MPVCSFIPVCLIIRDFRVIWRIYIRFSKRMADSSQLNISLILTWSGGQPFWTFSQGWKSNRIWFLYPNCLKSEMHRQELQCGQISQWIRRTCNDHNIEPIAMLKKTSLIKKRNVFLWNRKFNKFHVFAYFMEGCKFLKSWNWYRSSKTKITMI